MPEPGYAAQSHKTRLQHGLLGLAAAAAVFVFAAGCRPAGRTGITVAGSTSVQPFAELLAEKFMADRRSIEVNVQGGGSSAGVRAVQSRICEIGMSSRALAEDEKGLVEIPIALDAITLIVNARNPVRALSLDQARDIFSGRIRNWQELGGPDLRITTITREEGSGTRASFEEKVMAADSRRLTAHGSQPTDTAREENPQITQTTQIGAGKESVKSAKSADGNSETPASFAADALVQDSNGAVREIVASDPAAIGYISHGLVDERVAALALDGVLPTDATIGDGSYPVVRRFLFLTNGPATGTARKFIDFALSPAGQALLAEEGLIPVKSE